MFVVVFFSLFIRSLLAALPTGSSKLVASQLRIQTRINELNELNQLRKDLHSTHLDSTGKNLDFGDFLESLDDQAGGGAGGASTISPRTKQRLVSMSMVRPLHFTPSFSIP